ncbi:MAG: hypothetical protein Q7Q73_05330 [Verrucomicrobiota bacterium JB024]|nr:hypothetical protein [Verrucomicrobiota bacterium JB024]
MKPKALVLIVAALGFFVAGLWLGARWQPAVPPAVQRLNGWSDKEYADYCRLVSSFGITPKQMANFTRNLARLEEANLTEWEHNSMILTAQSLLYLQYLEKGDVSAVKQHCLDQIARYYVEASQPGYLDKVPKLIDQIPTVLQKIEEAAEKYPELKAKIDATQVESATAQEAPAE